MRLGSLRNLALAAAMSVAAAMASTGEPRPDEVLTRKAIHEVRMYPRYSIYDNIQVRVQDGNLDIAGQVNQPYKKADLQRIMQSIPGVKSVSNDLTVLPLSPNDDRLRAQVARAIYRDPVLYRNGLGALPSIHIIVENGHVTLEGVVSSEMERNVARIRANSAGLSFGPVVNHLVVENAPKKS